MANTLRSIFNPTEEELQERYNRINKIHRDYLENCGETCITCKHAMYVQQSPYYDYVTCKLDRSLEFGYGDGCSEHSCKKYEFIGYLKIKGE